MISRIFFANELACISPEHCIEMCGSAAGCSNVAYPRLVMSVMPIGLRGLMMAVMIAALMSDLDSIFNSASTIFTLDIYKMLRKQASSRELVIVGRLFVVFMVSISIAWVPVIIEMQGGQMFYYIQEVSDYLTPPIAALFLLGVLWHRCNETGAFWGGMVGFALGVLRLVLAFVYREPHCNQPDKRPSFIKDVHFMYVAVILFWVSALVMVVVSLCTPPPKKEQIQSTTLWGLNKRKRLKSQGRTDGGDASNALKPLKHENLNEMCSFCEEKLQVHPNKHQRDKTTNEATQTNNYELINYCPAENDCHLPTYDHMVEEEVKARAVVDGDDEDVGYFGGTAVEGGRCVRALEWICGFQVKASKAKVITVQDQERIMDELLYEPPQIKIILNIALFMVSSVGIFLFIYFSL